MHPYDRVCGVEISSTFHKMTSALNRRMIRVLATARVVVLPAPAHRYRGELRIEVRDPQGAALVAQAELASEGN
jgi:hypothetical protein